MLELDRPTFGQKRDLDRVFAGSLFGGCAGTLRFVFFHDCS